MRDSLIQTNGYKYSCLFFHKREGNCVILNGAYKCLRWAEQVTQAEGRKDVEKRKEKAELGRKGERGIVREGQEFPGVWSQRGKQPKCMGLAFDLLVSPAVSQAYILCL